MSENQLKKQAMPAAQRNQNQRKIKKGLINDDEKMSNVWRRKSRDQN